MSCLERTARWPVLHDHRAQCRFQSLVGDDSERPWRAYVAASLGQELMSMRFSHEAVNHVVRVEVKCGVRPVRSNARPEAHVRRAWNVELNDGAVLIAHKAVIHICPVNVVSCDLSIRIDRPRVGTWKKPGTLPASGVLNVVNAPCLIQQETVSHIGPVHVDSQSGSIWSKARAVGTLAGATPGARNIERGDDTPLIPQETVNRVGSVKVIPIDLPIRADCEAKRSLTGARARTRRVERGDGTIPIPQKTVTHESRVSVVSRDRAVRVDELGAVIRKGALTVPRARTRRIEDGNHAVIGANVAVGRID